MNEYRATVSFAGFIGADEPYTAYANDENEAMQDIMDQARDDLSVEDIVQVDDDEWEVTISFAGFIGTDETYTVTANSEEDATELALDEASADLEVNFDEEDEDDEY